MTNGSKFLGDGTPALGLAFGYTYDDIGNRKTATANGQTSTYTPTLLNQYTQRTVPGTLDVTGAAAIGTTVTVSVDNGTPQATTRQGETYFKQLAVDNSTAAQYPALKITGVKNLAGPNGEDAVAELTKSAHLAKTPEAFTYDADGNLTDDARWHYTWDGENRLIAIETSAAAQTAGVARQKLEFVHDGQGRRVEKKVSNWTGTAWTLASHTRFVYDGWNLLAEMNALTNNAAVRTYAWGADLSGSAQGAGGVGGLLSVTDTATDAVHFAGYDGNGNVSTLTSAADGVVTARYDYNAFGEPVLVEGGDATATNAFGFSTKFRDAETGHSYYGYRFYTPEVGRWPSRDPLEEQGGHNVYSILRNTPQNKVDLFGLIDTSDLIRAFSAIGAAQQACKCQQRVVERLERLADRLGEQTGTRDAAHEVLKALSESKVTAKDLNSKFKHANQLLTGLALLLAKASGDGSKEEILKQYTSNKELLEKIGNNLSKVGKTLSAGQAATSGDAFVVVLELGKQSVEYLSKGTPAGPITPFFSYYASSYKSAAKSIEKLTFSNQVLYEPLATIRGFCQGGFVPEDFSLAILDKIESQTRW